jgi:glycosyltransferase involved in cell wall biosynthesis
MLFIHGSLAIGGIETFFVRLAKERAAQRLPTRILLLSPPSKSNAELVEKARLYADVYFLTDWISPALGRLAKWVPFHLTSILPLNRSAVGAALAGVDSIHVSNGFCAHFAFRLMALANVNVPLSMGLYHSLEYCWGAPRLPHYERCNRLLFSEVLQRNNLLFFNEVLVDFYERQYRQSFADVNVFPLGVIDLNTRQTYAREPVSEFVLGSVGRLVTFKSYNFWMLDLVKALRDRQIPVKYLVYGEGPQKEEMASKIEALGIQEHVSLKGNLEHSNFVREVSQFDVFIGSGTAIVEAAGAGVPSVIGIENLNEPLTYGFFSDIPGFSYNEDGLYPKQQALQLLLDYHASSQEHKRELSDRHIEKAALFSIQQCSNNFRDLRLTPVSDAVIRKRGSFLYRLAYGTSFLMFSIGVRLSGKTLNDVISTPAGH